MIRWMIDDAHETMPWDALDAIVFDVGNVLLAYSPEAELRHYFPGRDEYHERLREKIFRTPYWNMLDRGTLTLEEAIVAMTGPDAALGADIRLFMEHWLDFNEPVSEGVEALRACKAHGKKVYLLTNYQSEAFDRVSKAYDFFGLADGWIVSAKVGMVKPDADIYRQIEREFSLTPHRTLFIDDTPANVEGALQLGWQGFCLSRPGKLRAFIGK